MREYSPASDKVRVVHLAQSEVFRPIDLRQTGLAVKQEKPFLLYVGGRQHYKNFRMLLLAYRDWKFRRDIDLVVVGNQWSEAEAQCLAELRLLESVRVLASVEDSQLCELYNRAITFVYPSVYEGFGIPVLEALACGCPVVASAIPSTFEISSDCPIYFQPTSKGELESALERSVTEGRSAGRVARGIELSKNFSWDRTAKDMLGIYRGLGTK
jgi:glycosyltransferase involved in cell wall biosynthesis